MAEKSRVETELLAQINEFLSDFPEYWEGEVLLKNKVIEDVRSYDITKLGKVHNDKTIEMKVFLNNV